jgi:putative tryptophan/tyrosine transport system substrate-binding protein
MMATADETAAPLASALVRAGWPGRVRRIALSNRPAPGPLISVLDRRAFLATLGGGLFVAPLAAEAQPAAGQVYRIGFFSTFPVEPQKNPIWNAFVEGLRALGYVEGKNLQIERRAGGQAEQLPVVAAELVALGLSVIVALGPGPSRAATRATATVPIVFIGVADPVGLGLVASLARPGGNVTGLASVEWEGFTAKQLQVIKETLPKASRVALLMNSSNEMIVKVVPQEQAAADKLGIKLQVVEAREVGDLESAFAAAKRGQADLVHVYGDPLTFVHRVRIAELALKHRLPTMHYYRDAVEAGGLLSLGPDWSLLSRNAGKSVEDEARRHPGGAAYEVRPRH